MDRRLYLLCICIAPASRISYDVIQYIPRNMHTVLLLLCFVVVMQSFIMDSHEVFIHIHQGCFAGTGAIVRLPQCQWSKPDGYGKISQCITTTKQSKAKTASIFLGIYCMLSVEKHCISNKYYIEFRKYVFYLTFGQNSRTGRENMAKYIVFALFTHILVCISQYLLIHAYNFDLPSRRNSNYDLAQPRALVIPYYSDVVMGAMASCLCIWPICGWGVSNHRRLDCLLNCLFMRRSKKTAKFRVTTPWEGISPVTGEFLSQRASNAENVSIW